MTIQEIREKVKTEEYNFLRENPLLGNNILLLGLGGSHAYGTNIESSDLDIRGCYLNTKNELLLGRYSEQVEERTTDTVVYAFNKIIGLLANCNPSVIELLGLKPEQYLYITSIGQELLDNRSLFLSQKVASSFGGYANQQLYKLFQKCNGALSQSELEEHICKTMNGMKESFVGKYTDFPDDGINLYIDKAVQGGFDTEIFMDIKLSHYPVRDYKCMMSEFNNMVKAYSKIGKQDEYETEPEKINKHMMHLVRAYYMSFDLLEKGEIITYREKEHDLLMDIRNGKYMNDKGMPSDSFMDMVRDLEKRFEYDKKNTFLPEKPDFKKIDEFVTSVNERVIKEQVDMTNLVSLSDMQEDYDYSL